VPESNQPTPEPQFIPNPTSPIILLKTATYLARVLLKTGVIDYLDDKAKSTNNPYDDFLVRLAARALKTLAEL